MKQRVNDVYVAKAVCSDSLGSRKIAGQIAVLAEHVFEVAVLIKSLYPEIQGIGHQQITLRGLPKIRGKVNLPRLVTALAELPD